jgi:hypothetical protein
LFLNVVVTDMAATETVELAISLAEFWLVLLAVECDGDGYGGA